MMTEDTTNKAASPAVNLVEPLRDAKGLVMRHIATKRWRRNTAQGRDKRTLAFIPPLNDLTPSSDRACRAGASGSACLLSRRLLARSPGRSAGWPLHPRP